MKPLVSRFLLKKEPFEIPSEFHQIISGKSLASCNPKKASQLKYFQLAPKALLKTQKQQKIIPFIKSSFVYTFDLYSKKYFQMGLFLRSLIKNKVYVCWILQQPHRRHWVLKHLSQLTGLKQRAIKVYCDCSWIEYTIQKKGGVLSNVSFNYLKKLLLENASKDQKN